MIQASIVSLQVRNVLLEVMNVLIVLNPYHGWVNHQSNNVYGAGEELIATEA